MAATCYLCDRGHGPIPGTKPGDALGPCQSCSVLACCAHGQRDSSYPRWICALCDSSLLTAAGVSASGGASLNSTLTSLVSSAMLREGGRFESLEQFLEQRPAFSWIRESVAQIVDTAPSRFTTSDTEPFW